MPLSGKLLINLFILGICASCVSGPTVGKNPIQEWIDSYDVRENGWETLEEDALIFTKQLLRKYEIVEIFDFIEPILTDEAMEKSYYSKEAVMSGGVAVIIYQESSYLEIVEAYEKQVRENNYSIQLNAIQYILQAIHSDWDDSPELREEMMEAHKDDFAKKYPFFLLKALNIHYRTFYEVQINVTGRESYKGKSPDEHRKILQNPNTPYWEKFRILRTDIGAGHTFLNDFALNFSSPELSDEAETWAREALAHWIRMVEEKENFRNSQ